MSEMELDILNTKEAAALLRLSPASVHKLKKEGKLRFLKMGGRVFYRRAELIAFVARSEQLNDAVQDDDDAPVQMELFDE